MLNRWDLLSAICSLTAFVLTLLGTIFPYWWSLHEHDVIGRSWTLHYGIWVIITCNPDECVTHSSGMTDDRTWLLGPAVLLIFASTVLLFSTVCTGVYMFMRRHSKTLRRLVIVFCSGAGVTIILAVLIFYKKKAGLRPSTAPETTDGDPDWSLLLATCGGVMALFNVFFYAMGYKTNFKRQREERVFGMKNVAEFEIDVNALRKGVLIHGSNITRTNSEKFDVVSESSSGKLPAITE